MKLEQNSKKFQNNNKKIYFNRIIKFRFTFLKLLKNTARLSHKCFTVSFLRTFTSKHVIKCLRYISEQLNRKNSSVEKFQT